MDTTRFPRNRNESAKKGVDRPKDEVRAAENQRFFGRCRIRISALFSKAVPASATQRRGSAPRNGGRCSLRAVRLYEPEAVAADFRGAAAFICSAGVPPASGNQTDGRDARPTSETATAPPESWVRPRLRLVLAHQCPTGPSWWRNDSFRKKLAATPRRAEAGSSTMAVR